MFRPKTERDRGFVAGVKAAAGYVGQFNVHVDHPYRLDDCILGKFNVTKRKRPRRNPAYCLACRRVRRLP